MAIEIKFKNERTNEIKSVKLGWSWTLFFFGSLLGLPLWLRKFYPAAAMMVLWDILCVTLPSGSVVDTLIRGASIGLAVMLGMRGNQATAQYYLKNGWELVEPESDETRQALKKWSIV